MISEILDSIFKELKKGTQINSHPFRYTCLGTVDFSGNPQQRMVVIRDISNNEITIYTDNRTEKVSEIKSNANASLLFYDYKKMKQLKLSGKITVDQSPDKSLWNAIPAKAKKDYTTKNKPGTKIKNPEDISYTETFENFCVLKFAFTKMDYLNITRPNHVRAQFLLIDNMWEGSFIVP